MRFTKLFATFIALATAVLLTVGLVAPAGQAVQSKPKHQVAASDQRVNNNKFIIKGKSTLQKHSFTVVKRKAGTKAYKFFAKPKTDNKGKFRFTITGGLGDCFAMKLPETGDYKATTIRLGCIHRV